MSKSRHWVFTCNNYTSEHLELLRGLECRYICWQPERGLEGTPHLQGLVSFPNPRALGGVRLLLRGCHCEPMRGTFEQARAYCSKEESRDTDSGSFEERGDPPICAGVPGGRSDLQRIGEIVSTGGGARQCFDEDPGSFIRYHRGIEAAIRLIQEPRDFKTEVYWYCGPTGTGKTRAAQSEAPTAYWKNCADLWWDGYVGQSDVILDDYRCDFCKFSYLLRLFDRYPLIVQYKGGTVQFRAKRIFVTAPFRPDTMWENRSAEDLGQLGRRITDIKQFS